MRTLFSPLSARLLSLLVAGSGLGLSAATLQILPSADPDSFHYGMQLANDGAVVGFATDFTTSSPLFWSKSGTGYLEPVSLGLPSGGVGGEACWISGGGAFITGSADLPLPGQEGLNKVPVLWTRGGSGAYAATALPRLSSGPAEAVITAGSADATRLVGHDGLFETATVWRGSGSAGYSVQALALPAGAEGPSFATAISSGGARIVGRYNTSTATRAVVWTEAGGVYSPRDLQTLAGGSEAFAETISADGALAAGASTGTLGLRPVVWDNATGVVTEFQTLPGDEATVLAIAENKAWFGGRSTDGDTFESSAVLWDASGRLFDLVALASADGAAGAFAGFTPESVTGIHFLSGDRYTIVGTGYSLASGLTEAFVIENLALATPIPEPSTTTAVVGTAALAGVYMSRRRRVPAPPSSPADWIVVEQAPRLLGQGMRRAR